jgi:tRNA threonylcarbamoyladenosine biosynthesis protein TsaB
MARILNIETATQLCSVALSSDGKCVLQREIVEERSHASLLTVFIEEILHEAGITPDKLDAVAVGKGPGSYTGLRIGVSTAKGLCYGSGIPLIAAGTLKIMATQVIINPDSSIREVLSRPGTLLCPLIDARRMEVFTCLFNSLGNEVEDVSAKIVDSDTFSNYLPEHQMIFFGSGMKKSQKVLAHRNAFFIENVFPHASSLALIAENKFHEHEFEDLAYFEPFYLKDFIATTPKKGLTV